MSFPSLVRARRVAAALAAMATMSACGDSTSPKSSNPATETYAASLGVNIGSMTKINDNLYYQDQVVGTGTQVTSGRRVTVTYTGWLVNGTKFDSNVGGAASPFTVGIGEVISGWDLGVPGMRVGGKRLLVIGSDLGYGSRGNGPIPPNATLVFSVQVLSVQ